MTREAALRSTYLILSAALTFTPAAQAAEPPAGQVGSVADLASLIEGEFTTAPATTGPAAAGPTAAAPGGRVLYDISKRVDVPALGHDAVYSELREGGPDGKLVWQRLYALQLDNDTGRIIMTPYSFANPQDLAGASKDPTPLAKLKPADLKPQPGSCIVTWHRTEDGFAGTAKPGSCKSAAADKDASIQPAIEVTKTNLTERMEIAAKDNPLVFRRLH